MSYQNFLSILFSQCRVSLCERNTHDVSSLSALLKLGSISAALLCLGENCCSTKLCKDLLTIETIELIVRARLAVQKICKLAELEAETIRNYQKQVLVMVKHSLANLQIKGLFTWREGAPANRATRLEGLKHSPPLHATHLTGTVSGLRGLSFERPAKHNKHNGRPRKLFSILFQLPAWAWACSLPETTRLLH